MIAARLATVRKLVDFASARECHISGHVGRASERGRDRVDHEATARLRTSRPLPRPIQIGELLRSPMIFFGRAPIVSGASRENLALGSQEYSIPCSDVERAQ